MMKVRKAIIPIAGLGTRFLPLSKIVPKEFWPLVDRPILQYIIEEAITSGIKEIIFVVKPEQTEILDYFKKYFRKNPELENNLKRRRKYDLLEELKKIENISKKISFLQVFQKKPLGDGHAILMAEKLVKKEPCAVLFGDDVVLAKTPCLLQLIKVFEKYQKPVMALYRLPRKKLFSYGVVGAKKIGNRVFEIKKIIEKPESPKLAPSDLTVVGKRIITPEVFEYLKKSKTGKNGEINLTENLAQMVKEGKKIYGCEFDGKWLECGNKLAYLKSNFYLSLKSPQFGKDLKKFLKENK
ncbi:MAG: sugar phosphate nucleotidyltransferase [Parcubacteria group bacterium]